MAGFSHANLKELQDLAADREDDVEARFGRQHLDTEHLGISYFRYGPNFKAPGHRHREQEEAYIVVGGSGRMRLDEEEIELKPWDVVRVSPEVVRGVHAGPEGIELIAVGSDRPEGGDGEIVKDFW